MTETPFQAKLREMAQVMNKLAQRKGIETLKEMMKGVTGVEAEERRLEAAGVARYVTDMIEEWVPGYAVLGPDDMKRVRVSFDGKSQPERVFPVGTRVLQTFEVESGGESRYYRVVTIVQPI